MKDYKLASDTWNSKEYKAINRVIKSNSFSMGKEVATFEKEFSNFFNSKYCVMVNSGSSANLLMIASLFFTQDKEKLLKRGDEIIVPAVSWSTTYFPIQQYGLKAVFVDIDLNTLNFNLEELEKAITKKTKAIFAVNLLGNSNNFNILNKIAKNRGILLLEDNCESMGAKFNNKFTGTFGIMGSFSSFYSHHIATMEGGYILTDDKELYHILLSLRAHGWTRNLPNINKVTGLKSKSNFDESFNFVLPGYNLRPLEMSAAIGKEQLKKLPNFIKQRRENAIYFKSLFKDLSQITTQKEIGKSSWFGFSIILKKNTTSRKDLLEVLSKHKIETRPIVSGNFLKFKKVLRYFDFRVQGDLKNARNLDKYGFFVGNHHLNIHKQLEKLKKVISENC
tara:strand:+ start:528 stop:1706 length:1179 start_codon:yes stop_codon:yes gene_type:complete